MSKSKTYVSIVLDTSGSMLHLKATTLSALNEYIESLKNTDARYRVTLHKFNTRVDTLFRSLKRKDLRQLSPEEYMPTGNTALYDAVFKAIQHVDFNMRDEDRALIVIITDGEENSSQEIRSSEVIRNIIKDKEQRGNWTFTYLSSHANAWGAAARLGIPRTNTLYSAPSIAGEMYRYATLNASTQGYAAAAAPSSQNFIDPNPSVPTAPQNSIEVGGDLFTAKLAVGHAGVLSEGIPDATVNPPNGAEKRQAQIIGDTRRIQGSKTILDEDGNPVKSNDVYPYHSTVRMDK